MGEIKRLVFVGIFVLLVSGFVSAGAFSEFLDFFTGKDVRLSGDCTTSDIDNDGDIDPSDFLLYLDDPIDLDNDGEVELGEEGDDFQVFLDCYGTLSEYELTCSNADFNCDGVIDSGDIVVIADLWNGGVIDIDVVIASGVECNVLGEYVGNLWQSGIRDLDTIELLNVIDEITELTSSCQEGINPLTPIARDYTCTNDQRILKVSGLTNAHGTFWNDETAMDDICYDEIFGVEYVGVDSVHECGAENNVLKLSRTNNAHAGEGVNICFGDLVCTSRSGACEVGEELIVSLSSEENAHVSANDSYPFQVCCTSAFAEGDVPPECVVDEDCVEDFGDSFVCDEETGTCSEGVDDNCSPGEDGDTQCEEDFGEGFVCDFGTETCVDESIPRCELGETLCRGADGNVECEPIGDCGDSNIICSGDDSDGDGLLCDPLESCQCSDCYGYADSCGGEVPDSQLICDFRTNSCQACPGTSDFDVVTGKCEPDRAPAIVITKPEDDFEKFKVGEEIEFEKEITNYDKMLRDININWYFPGEDEPVSFENCLTSEESCDIPDRTFDSYGYKNVKVVAQEASGLERSDTDYRDVLIYDEGLNLFAIISEPDFTEPIMSNMEIEFDASESFVAECFTADSDNSAEEICKTSAEADLEDLGEECYAVDDLWCYDYPQPDDEVYGVEDGFPAYDFSFEWKFFDKETDEDGEVTLTQIGDTMEGEWTLDSEGDVDDEIVKFDYVFEDETPMNHTVQLVTKYSYTEP